MSIGLCWTNCVVVGDLRCHKAHAMWMQVLLGPCLEGLLNSHVAAHLKCLFKGLFKGLKWLLWGRVTHICFGNLPIIGSDNGLSPGRCQAIIWTNAGITLKNKLHWNFTFPFKKMHLKMSSGKWWPYSLSLNVLKWLKPYWTLQICCRVLQSPVTFLLLITE